MRRARLFPYQDTWYGYRRDSLPFVLEIDHGISYVWVHHMGAVSAMEVWS